MAGPLFEIKDVDRRFYEERLKEFLPDQLVDIHTHVWLRRFELPAEQTTARTVTWPAHVARDNSIEDLFETYRLMFPGKRVTPLLFTSLDVDLDPANDYAAQCARSHPCRALVFSHPSWTGEELEQRVEAGGFLGAKSYLSLAPSYLPTGEIRIFDFFPPHQLEVLNHHGWIMILHIPRSQRLKDSVNLAQLLEIERRYPNILLVVAHVGRAYCPEDVGNAFDVLADTERLCFDISANTNEQIFERAIKAVGAGRLLFGSDLPVARMRMRRICRGGVYVNLIPRGLYGDVSGDKNMGELDGEEAERLTFFMYEQIDAFRRAAERCGLSRREVGDVFCENGRRLLDSAGGKRG